jgi:glycosyltransferase involved in cell wall biosynthesis
VIEANHVLHAYEEIGGGGYDIIHDNAGLVPAGVVGALLNERRSPRPILRTVHQAVTEDRRALHALLNGLPHVHFNAISDHQRRGLGGLKVVDTIHNAVDPDRYTYREDKQDYLAFLGRIIPEKGVHVAIDAADRAGLPLKIAGRIERTDAGREYFDVRVRPRLGRQIEYIGEVEHQQKDDLLSHARALIFPVQWAEPFGLVAIEALAAGTPVIASSHGALPEIIQHGRCGFLADEPTELDQAIQSLDTIRPSDCRERVRRCFGPDLMVGKYLDTYRTLLSR